MTHSWRRYVALGDSFTEGLEDRYPDHAVRGWADRLAQALADRCGQDVSYANLAIRGRLLAAVLAEQLEPALALEPDLVSLIAGGNDLLRPGAAPDALAADIDGGHTSTMMAHLSNIAWKTGRALTCDPATGRVTGDAEATAMWSREYEPGWEPKAGERSEA